ncbi:acyl-CoA dehydrogenase family protein [Streptomyces tropicalis]|uniref:Acyl-CoA dehydrogenase family protein n=1 Tax=Streptomyces tropicalis TaxID=3034234 RepID=A0ABT6A3Z5_9ACTN|nr:acyl-CoA dehydrogenase family protein [Streptomyces tropicalis]MDF3299357.1 acyl-CoA dehydrogenase family protein [Streptomyces tropicalis]
MASTFAHEQQEQRAAQGGTEPRPGQPAAGRPAPRTAPQASSATHDVTNQAPPLAPYDASEDAALLEGVRREGAGWAEEDLRRLGLQAGSAQVQEWSELANRHEPELRTHDRYGNRIDEVDFHPSWHHLMGAAVAGGLAGAPWADGRAGAHVARTAGALVWGHTDAGHACPTSMTYAAVPALRAQPELAAVYEPLLTSRVYEPGLRTPAEKQGLLAGMGMTEKQGGSDVRTNTTAATPTAEPGVYTLRGHKWFTSAPMCDVFLVLAQAPGGLSCFLVPRVLPDGTRNTFRIQRLKDKLGNRSNASSEPEFDGTVAWLVGPEGRGVKTIIEMVNCTRLDCVTMSAALMRKTLVEAGHHTRHRSAFGARLVDQPLMRNVLADLALESEAATTLALRLAGAADRAVRGDGTDEAEVGFRRIATAVGKYWVTKRGPAFTAEALECLGGNGYVEDSGMPRHYREAPLLSIWEGSGNVNALDVLRALGREPGVAEALFAELALAQGADARLDAAVAGLRARLGEASPTSARRLVELMALTLQGSLLVRHAPAAVADAFCATRLGGDWGHAFGTLPDGADLDTILTRALPDRG